MKINKNITPKAWSMKIYIINWSSLKLKTSTLQETVSGEWEEKPQIGKIFEKYAFDKELLHKVYK